MDQVSDTACKIDINDKLIRLHQRQRFFYEDLEGMLRAQPKGMQQGLEFKTMNASRESRK
jgi:hypothetical protein